MFSVFVDLSLGVEFFGKVRFWGFYYFYDGVIFLIGEFNFDLVVFVKVGSI